jgi:hypothetical protein
MRGDASSIKQGKFFTGYNWDSLSSKQLQAPFVPHSTSDKLGAAKPMGELEEILSKAEGSDRPKSHKKLPENWDRCF